MHVRKGGKPARDMGKQNRSYYLSMPALEQHLAVLHHNKQRGKKQNTLSSPAHISKEAYKYHFFVITYDKTIC